MERIADAVTTVVRLMVDRPDAVKMDVVSQAEGAFQFLLVVDPIDAGKVIGKQGRNARALRTLVHAMSMSRQKIISLEISE
jgi:uncharacterized protein